MGPTRSLARRLLLAAARVDSTDADLIVLLDQVRAAGGLDSVIRLARAHGVAPLLGVRLSRIPTVTSEDGDWLVADRRAALARHLHANKTVAAVAAVVERPFVVFKGPALARWYAEPAVRTYSDVDILVRRADFVAVLRDLLASDFAELSFNWHGFLAHQVAEVPLEHGVSCVDLHWDVLATGSLRQQFEVDVDGMVQRAEWIEIGGTGTLTFDSADTLLHLCVGAGLDGGRRLLQLVDIDRVVRGAPIDWPDFCERARRSRCRALSSAVLARSRRLLGTPVPDEVVKWLSPFAGWDELNRVIGERRLVPARVAKGVGSGLVVSAGRETWPATVAAMLASAAEVVRVRLGGRDLTAAGGELDWQAASSAVDADRERYLRWVEAG